MNIDFVVAWVDGSDKEWIKKRNNYANSEINEAQYRDWGIFKYWFRSIEQYAPWVNNIYIVTYEQCPEWLNCDHPKIHIIDHKDFIPEEYLPTFSSHTIELNLHRIKGLSEHFVYFNDDMYLSGDVDESFFFKNGIPCEAPIMSALSPYMVGEPFPHYLCNNTSVLNAHFDKKLVLKKNFFKWFNLKYGKLLFKNIYYSFTNKFMSFTAFHIPSSMLKSVFEEVWDTEYDLLHKTCSNKFRALCDVNQYVMSQFNICKGNFYPRKTTVGTMITINNYDTIYRAFQNNKYKMICVNDNPGSLDFKTVKSAVIEVFDRLFPKKSSFEK